ncbi:hypothetical protein BDY21DRAFT_344663 [Lineolata rhizophorae]|uniref:Uncharacterized protein n=1 Tax=Lineolata rhizophorae TaxID=578093 RepID=A0A6A6NZ48_9PEZI|nr:hypothetical protein BDY21DRAFT_344663 [Lineolata rhizophorae]
MCLTSLFCRGPRRPRLSQEPLRSFPGKKGACPPASARAPFGKKAKKPSRVAGRASKRARCGVSADASPRER